MKNKVEKQGCIKKIMGFIKRKTPTWSGLYDISNSKITRSSYLWFFIVPIFAKLISRIGPEINFTFFSQEFTFTFKLPFSWQLFFYGATFVALANAIYSFRCPFIIKKYLSFADFQKEGKTSFQLIEMLLKLTLSRLDQASEERHVRENVREFCRSYCLAPEGLESNLADEKIALVKIISDVEIDEKYLPGAFWHVRNAAERMYYGYRLLCSLFYGLGIACILCVLLQNIWYVVKVTSFWS